jgi:hypothetical protein
MLTGPSLPVPRFLVTCHAADGGGGHRQNRVIQRVITWSAAQHPSVASAHGRESGLTDLHPHVDCPAPVLLRPDRTGLSKIAS